MAESILRQHETLRRVNLGRTTIWRLEAAGEFPKRRRIHGNLIGWLESEIDEWIRSRPTADEADGRDEDKADERDADEADELDLPAAA